VPAIDEFLKEHLFTDIFSRDGLNRQTREAATVGALTNLGGASGQLRGHMQIALNQGITPEQMKDLLTFLSSKVGQPKGDAALAILEALTKPKKP
jgi:alkylhydroperoxidase/carboxymuconolactone decarboxylase family protein YurZ